MADEPNPMQAQVEQLYSQLASRRGDVQRYDSYFRGEQPLAYASQEWRDFHKQRFEKFSDNWCGVVANSPAERLRVTGVRIGEDSEVFSSDEQWLQRVWGVNELDCESSQGFLSTIVAGRSFVLVWPGEQSDDPQITWESAEQVIVGYAPGSSRRNRKAALKTWLEDDRELATLYLPDEIWKFERPRDQSWEANRGKGSLYAPGADGFYGSNQSRQASMSAAAAWKPREGVDGPILNPLGAVPVVEIPNRPTLNGEPMSDIGGTVAMQDAINLLWAYAFAAADFASLPARVVMGQEPPKVPLLDNSGNVVGERAVDADELTNGRMLWLTGQDTKIGSWESARLDVFTDVVNRCVRHVAAQTRTPVHYIVGEITNVNGETLVASETGLVKKVEEFQLFAAPQLREMYRLAALAAQRNDLAEQLRLARILWADPQTRTQAQAADAALKDRQVGMPLAWVMERRYGLSPAEAQRVLAMKQEEETSLLTGDLAAAFAAPVPEQTPNPDQGDA